MHYGGSRLPYPDWHFDVAVVVCVFHHVPPKQWIQFTKELVRVTKPGGYVLTFEHNPYNPATQWVVKNNELDKDAVLISAKNLKKIFHDASVQEASVRNILFTPFKAKIFRLIDKLFSIVPLGTQYVLEVKMPKASESNNSE